MSLFTVCDLCNTFDRMSHNVLLNKCFNYLSNRTQFVCISANCILDNNSVTYGVPHGLVLGPILFTIYVNNLSRAFSDC